MKTKIVSYRRGRHNMHGNQMLVEIEGCDSRAMASKFIGKSVIWVSPAKKEIFGKITKTHGNNGVLRARFSKGLPGTSVGKPVKLLD